jgi:sporulation protein YlmC with PRC-barrel domain
MGTTRLFVRGVLSLGLAAILSSYGLAAEPGNAANGQSYSGATAATPQASSMMGTQNEGLKRASHVMHAKVKSPDGTSLGRIYDVVLTPDLNGISYVAVSRGGILGIGNTLYAIPWSSLSESVNGTFAVPITGQEFKQSRGFSPAHWPSSAEGGWTVQGREPVDRGQTVAASENIQNRRFTHIRGSDVKGTDGKKVGNVHDLVIVMDTGGIAYTIVSYGGLLGLGQRFTAVPESAVTLEPTLHVARVDATPATLHANSFTPGRWPDLASPSYSQPLARAFGVRQPAGTALGYIPSEGGAVAAAQKPRTPTKPSARSTTPPAEPTAAELTGTFNAANVTTIDGTVTDEGKFQPTPSGSQMLWLRLRTSSAKTILVNLGPRSYISAQDFYIVPGDQIHLRGSEVAATAPGKQVFLPTEVTYNNHALRLRHADGTGLWEGQTTAPAAQSNAAAGTTTLGYTPAEEPAGAGAAGRSMTPFASADLVALGASDLSSSRTIDGTVTEVGKSRSAAGGPDILWLRVKTADGQFVNVQVGPRDYVSKQNIFVVSGDRVRLTGWNAQITGAAGTESVFVPADISDNDQILPLRNRNGEPLWTSQSNPSGQQQSGTRSQAPTGQTQTAQTPTPQTAMPGAASLPGTTARAAKEPNEPNKP